jgi:hypothetical protein
VTQDNLNGSNLIVLYLSGKKREMGWVVVDCPS